MLVIFTLLGSMLACSPDRLTREKYSDCSDYPLTQSQWEYLEKQSLEIAIPEGQMPVIARCDTNFDNAVDVSDIRAIDSRRNRPAVHPDDPMDWDKDGMITEADVGGCQQACSLPKCSVSEKQSPPSARQAGVLEKSQCFQVVDFNGDDREDFAGIFEHTGKDRPIEGWTLKVVILYADDKGEIQHIIYPFAGKRSETALRHHMSRQPAGVIDLMPGQVKLDHPGVVYYENKNPKVLHFFQNGKMNRAYYGVDD